MSKSYTFQVNDTRVVKEIERLVREGCFDKKSDLLRYAVLNLLRETDDTCRQLFGVKKIQRNVAGKNGIKEYKRS